MSSIKNVAIIMDGNGRWAKNRLRPRVWGHIRGSHKVNEIVKEAVKLGLNSLTLYAFSTENWSRPSDEVKNLFKILKKFLNKERKTLLENNIKFSVIGNYKVLNSELVSLIEDLQEETKDSTGMILSLAINYGGRAEIIDAVNEYYKDKENNSPITEEDITKHLYNNHVPEIDLMIRTAGDKRISNFLLWQISYGEFYFTNTKWPDFTKREFKAIIDKVSIRERRFGGLNESESQSPMKSVNQKVLN